MTVVLTDRLAGGHQLLAPLTRLLSARSRQQAGRTAELIERIVDAELDLIRALPVHLRSGPAERLAPMVTLAQAHRYYSAGWLSRREFHRRCQYAIRQPRRARELAGLRWEGTG